MVAVAIATSMKKDENKTKRTHYITVLIFTCDLESKILLLERDHSIHPSSTV